MSSIPRSRFPILNSKLPLYLGRRATARLDDGPSLVVSAPHRVDCRFPLARTSQLVAYAGAGLTEEVLLACIRQQIPVLWQDGNSSVLAMALPCHPQNLPWEDRIRAMLSHPGWKDRYASWLAAQRRMALRSLTARCRLDPEASLDGCLNALLHREGIRRTLGKSVMRDWETMSLALLIEYWRILQIPPESMVAPAEGLNIARDMAGCLVYGMAAQFIYRKKCWKCLARNDADAIHFAAIQAFERRRSSMLRLAGDIHARFHRWILDLESWR